jgi:hypothetical protein
MTGTIVTDRSRLLRAVTTLLPASVGYSGIIGPVRPADMKQIVRKWRPASHGIRYTRLVGFDPPKSFKFQTYNVPMNPRIFQVVPDDWQPLHDMPLIRASVKPWRIPWRWGKSQVAANVAWWLRLDRRLHVLWIGNCRASTASELLPALLPLFTGDTIIVVLDISKSVGRGIVEGLRDQGWKHKKVGNSVIMTQEKEIA